LILLKLIDVLNGVSVDPNDLRDHLRDLARTATGGHKTVPNDWTSPSGYRALCLGDNALVWLDHFGKQNGFDKDSEEHSFLRFIGDQGSALEAKWIEEVVPEAIQVLAEDWQSREARFFVKSLVALTSGAPALWKCALWWAPISCFGTADCIMRSDHFAKLFPSLAWTVEGPVHLLVLDVKLGAHLDSPSRAEHLAAYSAQVKLYSAMLGWLQGYMPRYAFLVGRDRLLDPLPVEVGMELDDPLDPELVRLHDLYLKIKLHGNEMRPWIDDEVAPNFSNSSDAPWHNAKKELARRMRPLVLLPHIGNEQAKELKSVGWTLDDLLTGEKDMPDFTDIKGVGIVKASHIEAVVRAHRSQRAYFGRGLRVPPRKEIELYADFEYLSGINLDLSKFPDLEDAGCDMVFMVGTGWEEGGKWHYRQWAASREDRAAEKEMFEQWLTWLGERGVFDKEKTAAIYHWSGAEKTQSARAAERHSIERLRHLPWFDLLREVFHAAPIGLPSALGFGLKEVATAISAISEDHAIEWPEELHDGLSAMVMGWEGYAKPNPLASDEFELLGRYLEVDCRSMYQVLRWVRDSAPTERVVTSARRQGGIWYRPELLILPDMAVVKQPAGTVSALARVRHLTCPQQGLWYPRGYQMEAVGEMDDTERERRWQRN
jgi:hypothetical protein